MALSYILDGYNIIQQIPSLAQKELQSARESLIRFIEVYRPQGSDRNSVTVVFDGKEGISHPAFSSSVKVMFSQNESADDKIRCLVSQSSNKKAAVVVTDDKELRHSVRTLGASFLAVPEFLGRIKKEKKSNAESREARGKNETKYISKTLEFKITEELQKIWLKK